MTSIFFFLLRFNVSPRTCTFYKCNYLFLGAVHKNHATILNYSFPVLLGGWSCFLMRWLLLTDPISISEVGKSKYVPQNYINQDTWLFEDLWYHGNNIFSQKNLSDLFLFLNIYKWFPTPVHCKTSHVAPLNGVLCPQQVNDYCNPNLRSVIMILQVRDYRADWSLSVTQPVAGNYYPVILLIII